MNIQCTLCGECFDDYEAAAPHVRHAHRRFASEEPDLLLEVPA